jgi:hypothetical protein
MTDNPINSMVPWAYDQNKALIRKTCLWLMLSWKLLMREYLFPAENPT